MFAKKRKISDLKEGEIVDDVFVVKFKKGVKEYTNGFSFELTLSDNSGKSIDYKYWGGKDESKVRSLYNSIKADSIVHVQGKVSVYKDKFQLATNEPSVIDVLEDGNYVASDFVKTAKKDVNQMYSRLLEAIEMVGNPKIKEMLTDIFTDKDTANKFKTHPGAIERHHNWIGGLMEHTLEVLNYCKISWETFPHLSKDLLIAGALLHDIGKLEEISVTSRIKGTKRGQLTGHLVLSAIFVSKKCEKFGLDAETRDKLLHILVSHHGKLEFGSPKEPMFPEAVIIYYSDELSSKITEILEFIEDEKLNTEDDFMFSKRNGKNILLR